MLSQAGGRVIGDTIEHFSAGEVILIPPNIPHCWSFDEAVTDKEGKIENITIVFTEKLLNGLETVFSELRDTIIRIKQNRNAISFSGEILGKLQTMTTLMISQTTTEKVSSLIALLELIATPDAVSIVGYPVNEDKKKKRLQEIFLYVMNNYPNHITLDDAARFAGMEKSSFCVFFKKMTGKSFFSYLTEYRVESSCEMLLKTSKSIAEICIASGFRDVPYYNRVFKKRKNITPSEYRRV